MIIEKNQRYETIPLENLIDLVIGGDWGKDETFEDEEFSLAYCIRGAEFKNWQEDRGQTASIRKLKNRSIETRKLQYGDILLEISGGGPEQPVGRTVLIENQTLQRMSKLPIVCTNFLRLVRVTDSLNKKYINQYLEFFYKSGEVAKYQAGSNNLRNLKFNDYKLIEIPIAPLPEQKAIVAKIEQLFSELDNAVANLKTAKAKLKIYRQAVLKKAFEGLPQINFEQIIHSSQNGLSKRSGKEGEFYKVLRLADIKDFQIVENEPRSIQMNQNEIEKYKLEIDDLICTRVNGSKDLVGTFTLFHNDTNWAFCDHFIRLKLDENSISRFYFYFLQTREVRKYIHDNMVSSAGQNTVSQTTVKAIKVPTCSIAEQNKIVQEIESRLSVCDKIEETIENSLVKSEALRQSILKKAFEGKLLSEKELENIKNHPEYESAEELLTRIKKERTK